MLYLNWQLFLMIPVTVGNKGVRHALQGAFGRKVSQTWSGWQGRNDRYGTKPETLIPARYCCKPSRKI